MALAALVRWEEACACYEQAVKYNDRDVWFWHNYGEALINTGRYVQASQTLERALEIAPDHDTSRQLLERVRQLMDEETSDEHE